MKICAKCKASVKDDCKFCTECGAGIEAETEAETGARVQEFAGKILKCPNCGEVLRALSAKCPACGFELREVGNSSSVKEFSEKLNNTISVRQKISLITNYPIPNAKADIFEFLILATSNFETAKYMKATGSQKDLDEAWLGKIEQCYSKAEALFRDDKDFDKLKAIYDSDIKELKKAKEAKEQAKAGVRHYANGTIMMLLAAVLFLIIMLKGSGILANPRLDITILGFFANGIVSYLYAGRRDWKLIAMLAYGINGLLNVIFCFVAPGHVFHVLIIVACALNAFVNKKSKEQDAE